MKASLVIPTWNAGPLLEEVLSAVDAQPGADRLERIAIDSGSTDGTQAVLQRHGFAVRTIPQSQFNHGATRDLGIEQSGGDVIVLLTQDATPADTNWLPALLGAYADPTVDAAWCRQIARPDCNPLLRRRIEEWMGDRRTLSHQRLPAGTTWDMLEPMQRLRLSAFDNVASSVRRTSWAKYRFGWRRFGEDVTFGKRVIEHGGCIAFVPESAVVHSHRTTPKQEGKRVYCDHQNLFALFGLCVIPTLDHCRRAVRDGGAHFLRQVAEEPGLSPLQRAELERWAVGYAKWTAWGQYLGANHERLKRRWYGVLFRLVDRWMHRP
ncbi:MAG: glycosyltransferase family 2 protein [Planctomycetes bacterium]|nr:glycosyltransferase family 2 protein [Planctomycetota bacterium]